MTVADLINALVALGPETASYEVVYYGEDGMEYEPKPEVNPHITRLVVL